MSDRDTTRRARPVIVEESESLRALLESFRWDAPLEDELDQGAMYPSNSASG